MAVIMQRFEGDAAIAALSARGDETSKMITDIMRLLVDDPKTLNIVVFAKTIMHEIVVDEIDDVRRIVSSGKAGVCLMTVVTDVYIERKGGE
jgi:hypothetical protein